MTAVHSIAVLMVIIAAAGTASISYRIWTTPVRYEVVESGTSAEGASAERRGLQTVPFSEVSGLGPAPLWVPVVLAVLAAAAILRKHSNAALVVAALFIGYCVIAGFSIGGAYILPACAILVAAILSRSGSREP